MPESPTTSDKIYSVSQLNSLAEETLEQRVGEVWVRGEISQLKTQSSGHVYFSLKDEKSVLSVALFRGAAMKLSVKLAEGKQVLVFGSPGIYSPQGRYQMVARFVLEEGVGRLQQEFERLKRQLESEGLFARENKIAIPTLPHTVAFVTSPTGAVWQDFTRILARRDWRGRVILFPCRVQGAEAPAEIVAQLSAAEAHPAVELIVVGRGGGSLEDLWSFNDERVVRAVAAMKKPIISAVGHETDFTLCDFAADFRAETPSAAAELIAGFFNDARQTLDTLRERLLRGLRSTVLLAARRVGELLARLQGRSPKLIIQRAYQRLDELEERSARAFRVRLSHSRERLNTLAAHLRGLDPATTLSRGYAMVRGPDGKLRTRAAMIAPADSLELTFADGSRRVSAK